MPEILTFILIMFGFQLAIGPFITWLTLRIKKDPKMEEVHVEEMPARMQQAFNDAAPALAAEGFVCRTTLAIHSKTIGVKSYAALWVAPAAGDMASVIATTTAVGRTHTLVGFDSQLSDGLRIETSNMKSANAFAPVPSRPRLVLSAVTNVALLYQVHVARVAHYAAGDLHKIVPEVGKDIEFFREDYDASVREQVEAGRFRYVERTGMYRATFRGAFAMTWGQIWPISLVRKLRRRQRALRELAQIGMNAFPIDVA